MNVPGRPKCRALMATNPGERPLISPMDEMRFHLRTYRAVVAIYYTFREPRLKQTIYSKLSTPFSFQFAVHLANRLHRQNRNKIVHSYSEEDQPILANLHLPIYQLLADAAGNTEMAETPLQPQTTKRHPSPQKSLDNDTT